MLFARHPPSEKKKEEQKRYEENKTKKQKESLSSRLASAERILMHFFAAFLCRISLDNDVNTLCHSTVWFCHLRSRVTLKEV